MSQQHLPVAPLHQVLFMASPRLTSRPPEKPECGEGREDGAVPMQGTTEVANEGDSGGLCPGKHTSDRVSGWAPWKVRRPNGFQIVFSAPRPSHHQVLKTNGRRPGRCSQSQRGSTGSARGPTHRAEQLPLHTRSHHSHRGMSSHLQISVSSSTKWADTLSPSCFGRHPRSAMGREAHQGRPSADVGQLQRVWLHIWSLKRTTHLEHEMTRVAIFLI